MSKEKEANISDVLNLDAYKIAREYEKENNEFIKRLSSHKLPKELDDVSAPLSFKEKRAFKDVNFDRLGDDEMEDFIVKLLDLRDVKPEVVDDMRYSDLLIYAQKVIANTFNIRAVAGKN